MPQVNIIRFYNSGNPNQYIGPFDFAGVTYILNPVGARYKRKKEVYTKEFSDPKTGAVEVRGYSKMIVVYEEGSQDNKINWIEAPESLAYEIFAGKYSSSKTPDGTFWKDLVKTQDQDYQFREQQIQAAQAQADAILAAAQDRLAILQAKERELEAKLRKLDK